MLFPIYNYTDAVKAVNTFDKIRPSLQKGRALVIEGFLNRIDKTIYSDENNPINKFDLAHVIPKSNQNTNMFLELTYLAENDIREFNNNIYSTLCQELNENKPIYHNLRISKKINDDADAILIKAYPDLKDYCIVFKSGVNKLMNFLLNSMDLKIFNNILDDLEFICNSEVLTKSHIARYMLCFQLFLKKSLYNNLIDDSTRNRLASNLWSGGNLWTSTNKNRDDDYVVFQKSKFKNFDSKSLQSYLKIRKRDFEIELVDSDINSDYKKMHLYTDNLDNEIKKLFFKYESRGDVINDIDIFKLNSKGFNPIFHFTSVISDGSGLQEIYYYVDPKSGLKYVIIKSKERDNEYFFISKKKNFRVNIKFKELTESLDRILESTITISDKYK